MKLILTSFLLVPAIASAQLIAPTTLEEYNYGSATTLMSAFSAIKDERFIPVVIRGKSEVYPALRKFFSIRGALA